MKLIAHRGGRCGPENSLEALVNAAKCGADAVECDVRLTKDGVPVIFHDNSLLRLAGVDAAIGELDYAQLPVPVLSLDDLAVGYRETVPLLLHIKKEKADARLAARIADTGLPVIAGVVSQEMVHTFAKHYPPSQILAFLPKGASPAEFSRAGAGILRLWEQWLPHTTPEMVKVLCPGADVFIMACNLECDPWEGIPLNSMDGSRESLDKCLALGADGVLLNDLPMALAWREKLPV